MGKYALGILAAMLIFGLSICYQRQVGYAPDEGNHIYYVENLAEELSIPDWQAWRYGTYRGHAYHLFSPLPYLPYLIFYKQIESTKSVRRHFSSEKSFLRLAGLFFTGVQFIVTLLICRYFFRSAVDSVLAALAVNLIPQLRYLHGYVNADSYSVLVGCLACLMIVSLMKERRVNLTNSFSVGLILSLILHAKYPTFMVGAFLFFVFLVYLGAAEETRGAKLRKFSLVLLLPALLGGLFHLSVISELANGNILAGGDHLQLMQSTFQGVVVLPSTDGLLENRISALPFLWKSLWGWAVRFGELPNWYLTALFVLCVVALVSFVKNPKEVNLEIWQKAAMLLGFGMMGATYFALALQAGLAIQGRLLFAPSVLCMLLIIKGTANAISWVAGSWFAVDRAACLLWIFVLLLGNLLLLGWGIEHVLSIGKG